MSDAVVRIIEIAFWDYGEAERAFGAIEKLLHDMGQIGQMVMFSPQDMKPLSAWSQYRPDDLTDDELAALEELSEEVIKSKGILIP